MATRPSPATPGSFGSAGTGALQIAAYWLGGSPETGFTARITSSNQRLGERTDAHGLSSVAVKQQIQTHPVAGASIQGNRRSGSNWECLGAAQPHVREMHRPCAGHPVEQLGLEGPVKSN